MKGELKMKNVKTITISFMIVLAMFAMGSCKKDPGAGGKKEISGNVTYTGGTAVEAIVSIAYDATEQTSEFDNSTVTDASGNYKFEGLQKGDYYIDAVFTDTYGNTFNTAGSTVTIGKKKGTVTVDLTLN